MGHGSHRFPDQWLIVGLVYPAYATAQGEGDQLSLALDH